MLNYNKYDNDLTKYLSVLTEMDIKDYVGDIVGDIYDAEIPSNIPDNPKDEEITCYTPYGKMNIEHIYQDGDELLIFRRIIGGAIYEEYILSMVDLLIVPRIKGAIYERRNKGIILTDIERKYEESPIDKSMRIVSSRECRRIYSDEELEKKEVDDKSIVFAYPDHFSPTKLVSYLSNKKLKEKLELLIEFSIPSYDKKYHTEKHQLEPSYVIDMTFNKRFNYWKRLFYHRLEGPKLIERVNSLINGVIDSESIKDIKTLMDIVAKYKRRINFNHDFIVEDPFEIHDRYELLFDLLNTRKMDIWQNFQKGTWESLATSYLGPSKVSMEHEYYKYIKSLVKSNFSIELPNKDIEPLELYNMLIKKYNPK